jgi:hypothetical protein
MKKLILLLLFIPLISFGQVSEQVIKFDNYEPGKYSKMEISFGGKYFDDVWEFTSGSQIIHFTPYDLVKAAEAFEGAYNKAVEWDKVADENNVEKLMKVMPFSFSTTKGMLEDAGYEIVGPKKAEFEFERFTMSGETNSFLKASIWQNGDYNVRSAYFKFPSINVRDKEMVDKFLEFLNFMKSNKSIIEKKIESSKADLFN